MGGLLYELAHLPVEQRPELFGDFSLNATNSISAVALLELGLRRLTPGYDLNAQQLAELAAGVGSSRLEGRDLPAPSRLPYGTLSFLSFSFHWNR
jgi:putative protease